MDQSLDVLLARSRVHRSGLQSDQSLESVMDESMGILKVAYWAALTVMLWVRLTVPKWDQQMDDLMELSMVVWTEPR